MSNPKFNNTLHGASQEVAPTIPGIADLEQIAISSFELLNQELVSFVNESLIIPKRISRRKPSRTAMKKAIQTFHTHLVSLTRLDESDKSAPREAWKIFSQLMGSLALRAGLKLQRRETDPLSAMIRNQERILNKLRKFSGIPKKKWEEILRGVTVPYHLSRTFGGGNSIDEYYVGRWKSRGIVSTLQTMGRIEKLMKGKWPKGQVDKIERLARIYTDATIVYEQILNFHLQLLSAFPCTRIEQPGKKATLGRLIRVAEKYPPLIPLLAEINVDLRNAIQHGNARVAIKPARLVWPKDGTVVEEPLPLFKKRVKRLVAIDRLMLMAPQIAGFEVFAMVRHRVFSPKISKSSKTKVMETAKGQRQ